MLAKPISVAIIGGGPAGLMAAEQVLQAGFQVDLYDAMPSVGRKFLLAGIGGLNITHSEAYADFCTRYAERTTEISRLLDQFGPDELRAWCGDLGIETFVGSSGRVFPKEMKAAPLLRAWLSRLKQQGLQLYPRHRCIGRDQQAWLLQNPTGLIKVSYPATILALGGGSWKKLGSDGAWVEWLQAAGIRTAPLRPANNGFLCTWSAPLKALAGQALKSVCLSFTDLHHHTETRQGELIITEYGVEGSLIYAFAARLRNYLEQQGKATFYLDLIPQLSEHKLLNSLQKRPAKKSLSSFLKSQLHFDPLKIALCFEYLDKTQSNDPSYVAKLIKRLAITVIGTRPLDEAISTAGGIYFEDLNEDLMLKALPSVFCAGEMLDWEAPTGGYLLTACFASGRQAGKGAVKYLQQQKSLINN